MYDAEPRKVGGGAAVRILALANGDIRHRL